MRVRSRGRGRPFRCLGARGGFLYVTGVKSPSSSLGLVDSDPDVLSPDMEKGKRRGQLRTSKSLVQGLDSCR